MYSVLSFTSRISKSSECVAFYVRNVSASRRKQFPAPCLSAVSKNLILTAIYSNKLRKSHLIVCFAIVVRVEATVVTRRDQREKWKQ